MRGHHHPAVDHAGVPMLPCSRQTDGTYSGEEITVRHWVTLFDTPNVQKCQLFTTVQLLHAFMRACRCRGNFPRQYNSKQDLAT